MTRTELQKLESQIISIQLKIMGICLHKPKLKIEFEIIEKELELLRIKVNRNEVERVTIYQWYNQNLHIKNETKFHSRIFNSLQSFFNYAKEEDRNVFFKEFQINKLRNIGPKSIKLFNELIENYGN